MAKRLFIGNLPYSTTEAELAEMFAEYGAAAANIPTGDRGPKGFGFVDVDDDKMEEAIKTMAGKDVGGRPLVVNEARPRVER